MKKAYKCFSIFMIFFILISYAPTLPSYKVKALDVTDTVSGGILVVASMLVGAGVIAQDNANLSNMATGVYKNMPAGQQTELTRLGTLLKSSGTSTLTIGASLMNDFCSTVRGLFGSTPTSLIYTETGLGTMISNSASLVNSTSPINVSASVLALKTIVGNGADYTYTWGGVTLTYNTPNRYELYLYITMQDGYKYKLTNTLCPGTAFQGSLTYYQPVLYGVNTANPNITFWVHGTPAGYGDAWTPFMTGNMVYVLNSSGAWVQHSCNLFNDMLLHTNTAAASAAAAVNSNVYNTVINQTYNGDSSVCVPNTLSGVRGLNPAEALAIPIGAVAGAIGLSLDLPTTQKPDILGSIQTWLSGLWDWIASIPNLLKGLWDFLINILNKILSALLGIPAAIAAAISNVLSYFFIPPDTFWVDQFNKWKAPVIAKFPLNLDILNSLITTAEPFDDVTVNIMGVSATIIDTQYIKRYITWIRGATSCFWILLLILFVWSKINYILGNSESVKQSNEGIGIGGGTGLIPYNDKGVTRL